MNFVYPQFLFALFALAIPVIVHLFNFRRFKRVLFTNVRFLQELKQDTRHRSKLKHLLVLASRLLALFFLVLAFAQPYIPSGNKLSRSSHSRVSLWIDNSFSMSAAGKYGPLLDVAKERARDIVSSYSGSDRFQLLTNDFEARHQRFVTREEFLQMLDEVRPSSAVKSIEEVVQRQADLFHSSALTTGQSNTSFLISDFQSSIVGKDLLTTDTLVHYYALPLKSNSTGNLYIDTCLIYSPFIQPGSAQELLVRVKNTCDEPVENVPVKLVINGGQRALSTVSIPASSSAEVKLPFSIPSSGFQEASVSITDYPVTFDDTFYFAFNVRSNVQVISINGKETTGNYLDALYGNDPYFIYQRRRRAD
jgi:hypothetical protein